MTKREWKGVIVAREDELIKQIKNGRRECLDELISLYYPAILRYCLWHMPDRESALDATQETFLKASMSISRVELTDDLPDASISDGETLLFCRKIR